MALTGTTAHVLAKFRKYVFHIRLGWSVVVLQP